QRLLVRARWCTERARLLGGSKGRRDRILLHRQIDVRTKHQRLAPETHGAIGVEPLRLAECALRLAMIEGVGKPQTLVEIGLRLRARSRDLIRERAEALP